MSARLRPTGTGSFLRSATVLLLIGVLFGVAPAGAEAAPGRDSVSYVALSSKGRGGSSGGGFSKSRGYQKSSGGGSSYRHYPGSSYSGKGKMPLWQAFLVLFLWGGLMVWGIVKLVRKFRKSVNA